MQKYDRHTLLDINIEGRTKLFTEAVAKGYNKELCGSLLLPEEFPTDIPGANKSGARLGVAVPGIVRREDYAPRPDAIAVGFTSWLVRPWLVIQPRFFTMSCACLTVINTVFYQSTNYLLV